MNVEQLCREYGRLSADIRKATLTIRSTNSCPLDGGDSRHPSHLRSFFDATQGIEPMLRETEHDMEEWKAVESCPSCLAIHNAIQQRREAKRKLGRVKSSICRLGQKLASPESEGSK